MKTKEALLRVRNFASMSRDVALEIKEKATKNGLIQSVLIEHGKLAAYEEVIRLCQHLLGVHKQEKKQRSKAR